jgi:tRNA(fMet)-specific endonuclease VapC
METKICLDTDFLINFLRGKIREIEFVKLNESNKELVTTYINIFELYYGAYKSNQKKNNLNALSLLLKKMHILELDERSARIAGKISAELEKDGHQLDFRDILIGSVALVNDCAILTYNLKHFQNIPGLKCIH